MASLRQKESGQYYIDYRSNGVRRRRSLKNANETRAKQLFAQFVRDNLAGAPGCVKVATVAEMLDWYVEVASAGKSANTLNHYRSIKNMVVPALISAGIEHVCEINSQGILIFFAREIQSKSSNTVAGELRFLKSCIRAAADADIIEPVKISWPKHRAVNKKPIEIMSADQIHTIFAASRKWCPWIFPVLLFLASSGWRINDVLTLKHGDIDRRTGCAWRRSQKTSSKLMLSSQAWRAVELAGTSSGLVFQHDGSKIAYSTLAEAYKLVLAEANCGAPSGFHAYRHTLAAQLAASGAPIKTIQAVLGHADVNTTVRAYQHYQPGSELSALESVVPNLVGAEWAPKILSIDKSTG